MVKVCDIKKHDKAVVQVRGFVKQVRDLKSMQFLIVQDVTGVVQVSLPKSADNAALNATVSGITAQSAVIVSGRVNVDSFVKLGGVEIIPEAVEVTNLAPAELPIDLSDFDESNRDLRLDWRFLDLRSREHQAIFRVQTTAEMAMREWWIDNDFIEIHSPKLMGNPSESGAELFELDYFGGKAYLAQSPQFYKQMGIAAGFERVFEIGPVFRANKSATARHDTEFTSVDCELGWIESHEDVMACEEKWIAHFMRRVQEKHGEEIREIFNREIVVPTLPFPRLTMDEAKEIIKSLGHTVPAETKGDLDNTAEKLLGKYIKEKFDHDFVFITEYPTSIRPFYHKRKEEDASKTKSFDLLWNGLEVTTGAQREHRYEVLVAQAIEKDLVPANALDANGRVVEANLPSGLKPYLSYFHYGCPPHGGFGFGLSRMLMNLLGYSNVREVTYVYRGPDRLNP